MNQIVREEAGFPAGRLEQAWSDAACEEQLAGDREVATQIGITGIPFFILDGRWILGVAVPLAMLRGAAKRISTGKP